MKKNEIHLKKQKQKEGRLGWCQWKFSGEMGENAPYNEKKQRGYGEYQEYNLGQSRKWVTTLKSVVGVVVLLSLSACSQETVSHGSSITTGTAGSTANSSSSSSTSSSNSSTPDLTWETESPQKDPDEVAFVKEFSELLQGFDQLNEKIEETYDLYLQYPDSSKAKEDYLVVLNYLIDLLRTSPNLNPPLEYGELYGNFVSASCDLADYFKQVGKMIQNGYQAKNTKDMEAFEELSQEILVVTERFSNTAFALMVAMEEGNLAG